MRGDAIALLAIAAALVGGLWFYFRATRERPKVPPQGVGDESGVTPSIDGGSGSGGGDP
jgi:hypothetical protein